jgi:hypothetical protein
MWGGGEPQILRFLGARSNHQQPELQATVAVSEPASKVPVHQGTITRNSPDSKLRRFEFPYIFQNLKCFNIEVSEAAQNVKDFRPFSTNTSKSTEHLRLPDLGFG